MSLHLCYSHKGGSPCQPGKETSAVLLVRRNIMPTVLSRAIFRGWSTLESRSSHNSGTWTYHPSRTWQIWQSKLLLFCPISLRNIFVTKSIKSDKFFSICWGGRRLIRSRAQSSCCSVILLKDTFLCNVWIICIFFLFYYSATRPCELFQVSDGPWWLISSFIWSGRYCSAISLQHL